MASTNPAKVLGSYDEIGSIEEGKRANLVFADKNFKIYTVILEGNVIAEEF